METPLKDKHWNGTRKVTWRRGVLNEAGHCGNTRQEVKALAKNTVRWNLFTESLRSSDRVKGLEEEEEEEDWCQEKTKVPERIKLQRHFPTNITRTD
jgi:hypothetical protein